MKTSSTLLLILLITTCLKGCGQGQEPSVSPPASEQPAPEGKAQPTGVEGTVTGVISDSMCGFDHAAMLKTGQMGKDDHSCTITCVQAGSKFVLADPDGKKIFGLSDQGQAKVFAGKRVKVKGLIDGELKVITVENIWPQ